MTISFLITRTDELFKSAAYLTEAFTGVQLPILASNADPPFPADAISPGTTTIPSASSFVLGDPTACATTTRSSSDLTHIVYPEDAGDAQPPSCWPPSTLEDGTLSSPPTELPISSQPLATESSTPLPPRASLVDASKQTEKQRLRPGNTAKPEKLPAFNLALRTNAPFFDWLENGGEDPIGGTGQGACVHALARTGGAGHDDVQPAVPTIPPNCAPRKSFRLGRFSRAMIGTTLWEAPKAILSGEFLMRISCVMDSKADPLSGFDWYSLPKGSTIVDVGGGIGSTTMILARALNVPRADLVKKRDGVHNEGLPPTSVVVPRHRSKVPSDPSFMVSDAAKNDANLRFVVQDRPVVTALGIEAWRSKCPEMLENGQVVFQGASIVFQVRGCWGGGSLIFHADQDFFEPQSPFGQPHLTRYPAVYLLRVVLHDWPDECARRILINLRVASNPETRLVIAEHVLPLACVDEDVLDDVHADMCERSNTEEWTLNSVLANVEGAERTLVPPPLVSNLGKASATAYWMDLIVSGTFLLTIRLFSLFPDAYNVQRKRAYSSRVLCVGAFCRLACYAHDSTRRHTIRISCLRANHATR